MDFRNIAIIAHVDHGKTTLVDGLLHQCNAFASHQQVEDRVMDSMDLERERGITITSKNTAVFYGDTKINILDTPGHADFGGEVERVLSMVEGAVLLVDAAEGPLPQTRFVLRKAMDRGLKIILCINKIDRPDARAQEVLDEVYDLFIDLDADEEQLDFPVIYACAKDGTAGNSEDAIEDNLRPLLDTIVEAVPAPPAPSADGHAQLLITNLDYDPYVGRLAIGRLMGDVMRRNDAGRWFYDGGDKSARPARVYTWKGLRRHEVDEVLPGDVVAIAGIDGITVGDTFATGDNPEALPRIEVDEPTIGMGFSINSGPFSGKDGKYLTARQIRDRLDRELLSNVSIKVEDTDNSDRFMVYGRGELQLGILIEQMRREGFELTVSRPEVVKKDIEGVLSEPWELVTLDVPDDAVGTVTNKLQERKGQMTDMMQDGSGRTHLQFRIPARGLIGFRGEFLTDTKGEGIMNSLFDGWDADAGFIMNRARGAMIADRSGKATTYSLFNLQPRGTLLIEPGAEVYEGMIVGIHSRANDLNVNIVRAKQLTNFRSAGADDKQILAPPKRLTLEGALEFIDDDELVEITPQHIRLRKKALKANQRSIVRGERK